MKDNAANIVAGVLIQSEIQRRSDEAKYEQEILNEKLNQEKQELRDHNNSIENANRNLRSYNDDLEDEAYILELKNVRLEDKVEQYEKLLCKPMAEIASKNNNFKETYEKQMELLAEWMVSQKAFKELAIQFGLKQGLSAEEVIRLGNNKKIDVLDDKHDPSHGSNASPVEVINKRKDRLRDKILGKEQ